MNSTPGSTEGKVALLREVTKVLAIEITLNLGFKGRIES